MGDGVALVGCKCLSKVTKTSVPVAPILR